MDIAETSLNVYISENQGVSNETDSKVANSDTSSEYKECANCGVNDTPLWRKYNDHDLCNACGIYFRVNGFHRPFLPNMRKLLSSARKMGLSCVNCGTKITSMWRRTPEGESICNACGLYYRLNGVKRPVSMRKDWIRKRQRKTQQISGVMRLANQSNCNTLVDPANSLECPQPSLSTQSTVYDTSQPCSFPPPFSQSFESCQTKPVEYGSYYTHFGYSNINTEHYHFPCDLPVSPQTCNYNDTYITSSQFNCVQLPNVSVSYDTLDNINSSTCLNEFGFHR